MTLLDIASRQQSTLLAHSSYSLLLARFSADGHWVSFTARVQPNRSWIFIAPVDGRLPAAESSWIRFSDNADIMDAATWAPDGKTLYFTSGRDGHVCIWARRIDPGSHQPAGEAFAVQHFHEHPMHPLRLWSVAGGQIAGLLTENTSSVWMMSRSHAR